MKKLVIAIIALLVLITLFVSCGGTTSTTTSSTPTTQTTTQSSTTTKPTTTGTSTTTTQPTSTTTTAPTGAKYGGTLTIIEQAAPGAPIGEMFEGNIGCYPTQQWALERLLRVNPDGTMKPELAESYDVNTDNGFSITFHLRKGVKFQDGTDWNADAAKWNLQKLKDSGIYGSSSNYWDSFDVIDTYTLRINYTSWKNTMVNSWDNFFFISPTAYQNNPIEWVRVHMVGTGPFMQTDYQPDVSTTLQRNPNYWDAGKPYPDQVKIIYVVDPLTREAMFKSGEGDILSGTVLQGERFQGYGFNIVSRADGVNALCPDSNNADSPWSKAQVRMAAEYAIDKAGIAKAFGHGFVQPAYQAATEDSLAYDPSLTPRTYDQAKAKQLLADAGYPDGFNTTIYVQPGADRDTVIAIKNYFANIGIIADVQFLEQAAFNSLQMNPQPHNSLIYNGITKFPNFNTTLAVFYAGTFLLKDLKKPDGFADLLNASLSSPQQDPDLEKKANDALFNDCTTIPVVTATVVTILSPRVQDSGALTQGSVFAYDVANVWLNK